ncbi:uncharacterized protein LOC129354959 isoform X2 [Poeciliopsis prolifica]|uniref:uncharacterized protein LOC129354959 isoform X2 n=1 Tax=Poeciliopsis prolifica TaxID=188132 RepID=UPI0024140FCD|nr:uncharacterized protein LOC129354959 isoform X2 [Poeciliopsis prolifica]
MLLIYLLLMLKDGCKLTPQISSTFHFMFLFLLFITVFYGCLGCKDSPIVETQTVNVGGFVKIECPRKSAGEIIWMRIDSENSPKNLGNTEKMYPHIKFDKDPGIWVLKITNASLSDSGIYFCLRKYQENKTFMKLTYLTVEESAVTTVPTSVPPHLHDSVTLHCSALRDSQNKSCSEDENLFCFRAESIETFPGFQSTDNAEESGFKFNSEECLYKLEFFKNSSLSDAQMYHCAVAKDDKNTSIEKSNPIVEENKGDSQTYYEVACLLSAALAVCLAIIAFLIYLIIEMNKQLKGSRDDAVALQAHEAIKENPESQKFPQEEKPAKKEQGPKRLKSKKSSTQKLMFLESEKAKLIYTFLIFIKRLN